MNWKCGNLKKWKLEIQEIGNFANGKYENLENWTIGDIETYKYTTSFINNGGTIGQIGTAGGVFLYGIEQTARTSSVYITSGTEGELVFTLKSTRAGNKKSWVLNIDITVQLVNQLELPLGTVEALYQNYTGIQLMNYQNLLWN